jgi:glycosyltransferase involved in cell wall biosynthesis
MQLSIIIPAYNEEKRIERTIRAYHAFLCAQQHYNFTLIVVLNGCVDNTNIVVQKLQAELGSSIELLDLKIAGKGFAIKEGFLHAVAKKADLIGFVDADMATEPVHFFDLVQKINGYDGIIASRYMPGSSIYPPRPFIKRWGSKLVYESLIKLLFGISYHDFQCGAKLFKYHTVAVIAPKLSIAQWAFDVELLYLCRLNNFTIHEQPTTWHDQADSKLRIRSGFVMLANLIKLRLQYSSLFKRFKRQ